MLVCIQFFERQIVRATTYCVMKRYDFLPAARYYVYHLIKRTRAATK